MQDLTDALIELVRRASTLLPADMERGLKAARDREEPGSAAQGAFDTIIKNVELARSQSLPICQDTGTPIFDVYYPVTMSPLELEPQIRSAVAEATRRAFLRPNSVDSLTGATSGDNLGQDFPSIHFIAWDREGLHIDLLLKGGGCENVSTQYKLPDTTLKAGRDLDGVRKVVLDAVTQAQGEGCAPGVLGVAIGGDRGSAYTTAKRQLHRPLDDRNPNPDLAALEDRLLSQGNELGIGPMGFGGSTTLLGVKVAAQHRVPASYFVSIAYMCWANRHASMDVAASGEVTYA